MLIGIGGVSRSGKSTLAEQLSQKLRRDYTVEVFDQDDYAKSKSELPKIKDLPDWDQPESIDWERLKSSIDSSQADVKIVEGLFAFYSKWLRGQFQIKLFLNIDYKTFITRREEELRWGPEPRWYLDHVWKSYLQFGTIAKDDHSYIILDGTDEMNVDQMVAQIISKLPESPGSSD